MELNSTTPEKNTFKTISIQTTYKCQMACSNCYLGDMLNNDKFGDVDLDRFEQAIKKLPSRCDIRFIGAEPTMNPQLHDLVRITRQSGHRPSLLTNGLKLRREDYTKSLKEAGVNMLGLSMNGGLDNDMYDLMDNGKYAKSKMIALENCFKYRIVPHVNVILIPDNLHIIKPLLDYIISLAKKYDIKLSPHRFPVMFRIKSVGQIGNFMKTKTFSVQEMADIMREHVGDFDLNFNVNGYEETATCTYSFETEVGTMLGKITDWSVDDDGIPDSGSKRRGILTDDYMIAPFFEYYYEQEEVHNAR